jgi:hypothetical protein
MFKQPSMKLAVALALTCAATNPAEAQDAGALVNALIKKGVLTDQEGEEVRADMTRDFAQTNAGKINLSSSVTELKLYGDFRYRWQYDDRQPQVPNGSNVSQRSRHRFRLRLNADVTLTDNFYAGFSLESGQAADSGNQTFENGFDDYNIFISKAFLGWKPNDWLNVTVGKFKNPFYTTDLVWDADINPQGAMETIAFHKMPIFGGSGGPSGDVSKDGKSFESSEVRSDPNWELTFVAGQFIFDDNNEFNLDNDLNTDAYLFVEQLIATWKFNKDVSVTVAPGFMTFTASDLTGLTNENPFTDAGAITIAQPGIVDRTTTSTVLSVQDTVNATGTATTRVTTPTTVTTTVRTTTNPDGTQNVQTVASTVRPGLAVTTPLTTGGPPNQQTTTTATVASAGVNNVIQPTTRNTFDAVSGETRQLHILTAPGDLSFKLGGIKTKLYWDAAYNLSGRERFNDIYDLYSPGLNPGQRYSERDGFAWLAGLQFGELKKKGDFQAYVNYRETGIVAVDPNLNDSDFALGELNTRGFKVGLGYAFSDAVVFNVTGYMAWNLNEDLVDGRATNAPAITQDNAVNVIQVDLNVKF